MSGNGSLPLSVRFWGVRGSVPAPLTGQEVEDKVAAALCQLRGSSEFRDASPERVRELVKVLPFPLRSTFGGNTTCVEVRCGRIPLILDMGTGLRQLGNVLVKEATRFKPMEGVVLQSHLHWDHIHGFPFWPQVFIPPKCADVRFRLFGGTKGGASLEDALRLQMSPPVFPVSFEVIRQAGMRAEFEAIHDGFESTFGMAHQPIQVLARKLNHPQDCYGFRIEFCGASLAFTTDHEPFCTNGVPDGLCELVRNADIWITDCQYSMHEYLGQSGPPKYGWGHSFPEYIANVATQAGVRRIVTTHHDPASSDERIIQLADEVQQLSLVPTVPAYEGLTLEVGLPRGT
ncbi:MAG: MBL fold metallo-hydrolase [Patescibacteria group bacterium]